MEQITRIDYYLANITDDPDAGEIPEAVTRIDFYLAKLCGEDVELPTPVTRIDFYLAKLCGEDVEVADPVTRIDYYLASLCGPYDGELPEPVTRIDYWLKEWAEGGNVPWTTFTGNPLEFSAPKAHALRSAVVEFEPKQDLSNGDPSPQNICPITGWTGVEIQRTGENLLNCSETTAEHSGVTATRQNDGCYLLSGVATANAILTIVPYANLSEYKFFKPNETYILTGGLSSAVFLRFGVYGAGTDYSDIGNGKTISFTEEQIRTKSYRLTIVVANGTDANGIVIKPQINLGSTASPYEPYSGTTYSLPFGQTVYGGTVDAVSGTATDDWENIASYNGETITEPWLSSMDKYVSGATPTTGAQVVYKKATGTPFSTTPVTVEAIKGHNIMWTDGSNLTVEAQGEATQLNALQSLNLLMGGRYVNNHTADDLSDEEALRILMGEER